MTPDDITHQTIDWITAEMSGMQIVDQVRILAQIGRIEDDEIAQALGIALSRIAAHQGNAGGVAWECIGQGLKKYVTDKQYRAFTTGVQRWYKPYSCTNCPPANATEPAPQPKDAT